MDETHHGARIVGADRQGGDVDGAEAIADLTEAGEVAGVSGVVEPGRRSLDDEAGPQALVLIGQRATGEVLRRNAMDAHRAHGHLVPPVELDGLASRLADQLAETQGSDEARAPADQGADRVEVGVIVVVV